MEYTQTSPQEEPKKRRGLIILIVFLLIGLVGAGAVIVKLMTEEQPEESDGKIGYSKGVVLMKDSEPPAYTPADEITLEYKGYASSEDGQTFDCYILNAVENTYDMYIDIYADAELTDELFLSELFKPGTGFESITLNRALESGTHTCYLVFTQVEDDQSAIHKQTIVTIDLVVQ